MSLKRAMQTREIIIATLFWSEPAPFEGPQFRPEDGSDIAASRCRGEDLEDTLRTLTKDSLEGAIRSYKATNAPRLTTSREARERVEKISAMQKDLGTEEMTRRVKAVVEMALERQREALETEVV